MGTLHIKPDMVLDVAHWLNEEKKRYNRRRAVASRDWIIRNGAGGQRSGSTRLWLGRNTWTGTLVSKTNTNSILRYIAALTFRGLQPCRGLMESTGSKATGPQSNAGARCIRKSIHTVG